MRDIEAPATAARLEDYFERLGDLLGDPHRRASFALYAMGLLSDAERKSIEPLAARACPDPEKVDAVHQQLLHFTANSRWSDRNIRRAAAQYALPVMTEQEPVEVWIVDDTGFLKQGTHSVGVQHQYTGSAGKIANCQLGVSLTIATRTQQLPVDFELYLPESWANDPARRQEARIPKEVTFKTKPRLALEMIHRAKEDGLPQGVVQADCAYGTAREFRDGVRAEGLHYVVGVDPKTSVWLLNPKEQPQGEPLSVRELAFRLQTRKNGFRRCTWRQGTKEALTARFALRRVVPAYNFRSSGTSTAKGLAARREHLWLLIEWRDGEAEPANYFFTSLPVRRKKQLIRLVMQRWRTERVYEDMKGELGLDHYEGRRFPGWHHHVSVALCCYAFLVAEQVRLFSPSTRRGALAEPDAVSA